MTQKNDDKSKFRLPVLEVTEMDARLMKWVRDVCKWVLDLLRNVIIVGVIQYLAVKTGNIWIRTLSWISYAALLGYCASYVQMWSARADVGRTTKVQLPVFIAVSLVLLAVLLAVNVGLYRVIDEIAKAQTK